MTRDITKDASELNLGYWKRVAVIGETGFALPRCADCGRFHFYPRPACPCCRSTNVAPSAASGHGTIYSYSVVHRAPSAAFKADVPYVIAIIATDEGPHLMSRLINIEPDDVNVGLRVKVVFGFRPDPNLPVFEPEAKPS